MKPAELAAAIDRSAALSMKVHMIGDAPIEKDLGLGVARRAGLVCLFSTKVSGALSLARSDLAHSRRRRNVRSTSHFVTLRHYSSLGLPTRFEILHPAVGPVAIGLLERNGFRREPGEYQVHLLLPRRAPSVREVDVFASSE